MTLLTKEELIENIKKLLDKEETNFNCIDTSAITDMSNLFRSLDISTTIDISYWDVSNVECMTCMFYKSKFGGDISKWDVGNVKNMEGIFLQSPLEKNPPKWYKK